MDREVQTITQLRQQWQKDSTFKKTLIVVNSVLLLIGIITVVVVSISIEATQVKNNDENDERKYANDVCQTPECIATASRVLRQMDETIDPCDDFYNFACGNFMKETKLSDGMLSMSHFTEIHDIVHRQLHAILDEKVNPNHSAPINMVKIFYKACMNTTLIEARGLVPMITIMDQLGGWPVVKGDGWDMESEWSWTCAVAKLRKLGLNTDQIISFSIKDDKKDPKARMIYIDQAKLNLGPDLIKGFLLYSDVSYYKRRMVNIAVSYGAERTLAEEELMKSLKFETKLAKISLSKVQRINESTLYNPYTLKQLQRMYPYILWVKYINDLLPSPLSVDGNEVVVVKVPSYFKQLGLLLRNTPKRTIANYLMWRVIESSSSFLSNDIHNSPETKRNECIGIIRGNRKIDDDIIERTNEAISIAVGAVYVRKYFRQDSKTVAMEMVNGIRKQLERILNGVDWMDDETRNSALNKLKAMSTHIGYPDELLDNAKIEEYYKNLEIDENNYFESILNISKFYTDCEYSKLRGPVNKTDWIKHARTTVVNAFYALDENSISKKSLMSFFILKIFKDFYRTIHLQQFKQLFYKGISFQWTVSSNRK